MPALYEELEAHEIEMRKFHKVAFEGDLDELKKMMVEGVSPEAELKNYKTALMTAASAGHLEVVKYLVKNGAKLDKEEGIRYRKWGENYYERSDNTALVYAVKNGHMEVVKYLIDAGANVNLTDDAWNTPLTWAWWNERIDIYNVLKEAGGNHRWSKNELDSELVKEFIRPRDHQVIKELIQKGADVNTRIVNGEMILIRAIIENDEELALMLVDLGADPTAVSFAGYDSSYDESKSALQLARSKKMTKLVKALSQK